MLRACAILAISLLLTLPSHATEIVTDEDRLLEQIHAGQIDAARTGFAELVDARLVRAQELQAQAADGEALERAAVWVSLAARALAIWQSSEMHLRGAAPGTPAAVTGAIVEESRKLHAAVAQLEQSGNARGLSRRSAGGEQTELELAIDKSRDVLLKTVAFTRDQAGVAERSALLSLARGLGAAPASVDAFDAANPDAARYLGAAPVSPPAKTTTPKRRRLHDVQISDAQLRPVLQSYYEACFADRAAEVHALLAAGYEPGGQLAQIVAAHKGRSLVDLGPVTWRHLGKEEIEVTLGEIRVTDPASAPQVLRDQLVLKRQGDGGYRIAYLGSVSEREGAR